MCNDLHVTGIRNKKLSYWKKRLLIRTVFVLIDVRRVWDEVKHRNKKEHSNS